MDIKRTILIVALAIVSYVMVLKWNQDYGQAALPTQNVASSTAAPALPDTVAITRPPAPMFRAPTIPAHLPKLQ
jgi:YidC/Oxa1 family membrane protein insertase